MDSLDEFEKNLLFLIRRPPLGTIKAAEAVRMALGQSTTNHVTLVLADAGVWLASPLKPELVDGGPFIRHMALLLDTGHRVWVEGESLERYGLRPDRLRKGVEVVGRDEIEREMLAADFALVF